MNDGLGATRNLFLVGPMGSGKTAVGKQLARARRCPFVDSDLEIVRRTGVDIPYIFDKEGEAGFRIRERDAIEALTRRQNIVLATGGGAVLLAENRTVLRERGTVVYLETSVADQLLRVRRGENRPLLAGAADLEQRLTELMAYRDPIYRQLAHIVVRTDGQRVAQVAAQILAQLTPQPTPYT
jgi:shikimate kinase